MTTASTFDFIGLIAICSLLCFGMYACCQFEEFDSAPKSVKKNWPEPGWKMIFWFVRYYIGRHITEFQSKPLYSCPPCMGSVYSVIPTIAFLLYSHISLYWFVLIWPVTALCVAGLNYIILEKELFDKIQKWIYSRGKKKDSNEDWQETIY